MIKKKFTLFFCVVSTMGIILWSCLGEPVFRVDGTDGLTVAKAQAFFENQASELTVSGLSSDNEIPIIPLWDYGKSFNAGDIQTVQVPLNIIPGYSYGQHSPDSVFHRIIANTVTYLVLQKEIGEKEIVCRVVRFIASDSYLMNNPSKLFRLSLLSPGDYTGRILYYDIRGNLLEGGCIKTESRLVVFVRQMEIMPLRGVMFQREVITSDLSSNGSECHGEYGTITCLTKS